MESELLTKDEWSPGEEQDKINVLFPAESWVLWEMEHLAVLNTEVRLETPHLIFSF